MRINFSKYQGTGNDFVIIDNRTGQYNNLGTEQVRKMCDRKFGIGADGLMLLNLAEGYDFEMIYYNADGKEGSMCGNGGRCLVQFAHDLGMAKHQYTFIASDGPHIARFDVGNNWVQLKMKDVNDITQYNNDCYLDTGSPHYIKKVEDVDKENVFESGKAIRYSQDFSQKGINVNFVQQTQTGIKVRTYERGVEDETLSCGTGVTASALVAATALGHNRVEVSTPGGDLAVEFYKTGEKSFENIWLCGPATFVFTGEISI